MEPNAEMGSPMSDWWTLSKALEEIRDSWVLISFCLTDFLAETPSPQRDETVLTTERYLHGFRLANHDKDART